MYKIIYHNINTNTNFHEYGFAHYILKRYLFLLNNWEWAEQVMIFPLDRTWKIFKKCVKKEMTQSPPGIYGTWEK